MKLTLYRNCFLNNSYTEVFEMTRTGAVEIDGKYMTALEGYLYSLDKFEYENDFIYTEGNGVFQLELDTGVYDVFDYNYLKVEEFDENGKTSFKRYCFIDSIEKISVDVVSVSYSEDIWSSYSGKMEIRDGVVSNKYRIIKPPYYLPIPYDGNNFPNFAKVGDFNGKFIIVCQLQLYKLTQEGVPNQRLTYTVGLVKASPFSGISEYENLDLFDDTDILNLLVQSMASTKVLLYPFSENQSIKDLYYYEVDNFTLIPATQKIIDDLGKFQVLSQLGITYTEDQKTGFVYLADLTVREDGSTEQKQEYFSMQLPANFHRISFGSLLSQYAITENGSPIDIKIELFPTKYDFKIILSVQNKIIDITNDFVVKMPFTSLNSEENTSRKLQRELASIRGAFDIVQGTVETATQIAGAVVTGGLSLTGGTVMDSVTTATRNYSRIDRQLTSQKTATHSTRQQSASASGLVGGVMKIANGITDVVYANKPKYSSTQGTFATSDGVTNAINGFGAVEIVADNEEYVERVLKRQGYTVFMTVASYADLIANTELDPPYTEYPYNIIKMETVMVYGSFPQDVAYRLTEILRNGIRIFYTNNVKI